MSNGLSSRPLTRGLLMRFKTRAMRQGAWFNVLESQERGLVDVTVRWVDRVRSHGMARILLQILLKLVKAMESRSVTMREKGRKMALRISELAVAWGNQLAWNWRVDDGFQMSLGIGILCSTG